MHRNVMWSVASIYVTKYHWFGVFLIKNFWKGAYDAFLSHLDIVNVMVDCRFTPGRVLLLFFCLCLFAPSGLREPRCTKGVAPLRQVIRLINIHQKWGPGGPPPEKFWKFGAQKRGFWLCPIAPSITIWLHVKVKRLALLDEAAGRAFSQPSLCCNQSWTLTLPLYLWHHSRKKWYGHHRTSDRVLRHCAHMHVLTDW